MIARTKFFFKNSYWRLLSLVGVTFEVLAVVFWDSSPRFAGVIAGVGGSILATVIVTLSGPEGEAVYKAFLRLGVTGFWSDRSRVPNDQWVKWLSAARRSCVLFGHANGEWTNDPGFEEALVGRLKAGVNVEIFFLRPDGAGADLRHREDSLGSRDTKGRIRGAIRVVWNIRENLDADLKKRLDVYVYDTTPSLGVTWIDDWMLVTHYLAGSVNLKSPALRLEARSDSPYDVYRGSIKKIRESQFSEKLTSDNINSIIHEPAP